ncbi:MAG: zinc metallopeptidase [Ruminococcus sp.]|nr:zinc metallopeptidase [Ruminococcus sp.]
MPIYYYETSGFWTGLMPIIIGMVICLIASWNVKATFKRYSDVYNARGLTAAQAARQILDSNGLHHVPIERVSGNLTDHYDPRANVVRLSESVYDSASVASLGVAAHECGHAVQHAVGYAPIKMREAVLPLTNIGSNLWYIIFVIGLALSSSALGAGLVWVGIILFSLVVLFQVITLPVEFNASRRALDTLENYHILDGEELNQSAKVLRAAALTYVAAVANALLQLFRLLAIANRRRR